MYCGPLRLLAWEVAKRLNKANVPCDLITGQEKDLVEGANHKSVTVEMADVTSVYDCAIIDEIQASLAFYFGRRRNSTINCFVLLFTSFSLPNFRWWDVNKGGFHLLVLYLGLQLMNYIYVVIQLSFLLLKTF